MSGVESMAAIVEEEGGDAGDEQDNAHVVVGAYWVPRAGLITHIEDQGSFPSQCFERLSNEDKNDVLMQIATYAIELISGGLKAVKAERDGNNRAHTLDAPPVLPTQLVKLCPSMFIRNVLEPYRPHIEKFWSEELVDKIEDDHRLLLRMYTEDVNARAVIDQQDMFTLFNDAWGFAPDLFVSLRSFCGGLASAFANTTSIESDFSILKFGDEPQSHMHDAPVTGGNLPGKAARPP